jgi:hypothetical protein
MADYIIKGEAGKTLDASDHLLGADLLAVNASLRFENLGPDVLTWTCRTESIAAGETIIPDVGQRVELWSASGLARYFRGWVTQARSTNYGVQVVVEGPWQWLQKIDITTELTSFSSTQERPTIIFNEATVTSNITALLNRAIALNAPIAIGTIASTFTIPKLQLSMMTCADVLAELMRWVPDCVGWWDYNGSGTPTFNLSRRGGMSATTYTVGTSPLVDFDLTGREDLVPTRVEVKYIQRTAAGRPEYQTQASGTASTGKVQVIGLSGKELDTFLPADDYQSYTAATSGLLNTSLAISNAVKSIIPEVVASRTQFGNYPRVGNDNDAKIATGETLIYGTRIGRDMETASYYEQKQPELRFTNPETGAAISVTGKRLVIGQAQPDWATDAYANAEKVLITGRLYRAQNKTRHHYLDGVVETYTEPPWSSAFGWTQREDTGFYYWGSNKPTTGTVIEGTKVFFNYLDFEVEAILTTENYSTPQTIYKPQDYSYLAPPTGLATSLLSAQNFTPYEGSVRLAYSSLPPLGNELQYKVNLVGSTTPLSTAGALVRVATFDLAGQSLDLEVGAPSRFNFSTLGGKVRQTPQTNITIN